jgi:drug/metabolite transporter superfamily protein YnfA
LEDAELPLQDLTMDVGTRPRRKFTAQQAAEDVERLFYLFSHGYSGYAFFDQQGEFGQAKTSILQELSSQSSWSSDALSSLLHEHLHFIVDCHMRIGDYRFAGHADFWYDTRLELTLGYDGYQFASDGDTYTVGSINDSDPSLYVRPSLNQQGEPIYRLGLLSMEEPAPLLLNAAGKEGERPFEIKLRRSDFDYYSEDVFREDVLGGIPVVRVRSFSDYYADELSQFVETAGNHRGEPVVILDIRGNGGGNERWPTSWIQRLTGERPESVFVFSELESKTSMIGRANALRYFDHRASEPSLYGADIARYTRFAESLESGERQPRWTGPRYPQMPLIANDTTVIVVTNDQVASAGEGLIMRISQAENVVVVGENSMGALIFGNISAHRLPHSGLMVWLPINFGLYLDGELREGVGLEPDLWVPAADAVNYAVAAVRKGTITTAQPLPSTILQQEFTPENSWARASQEKIRFLLVVTGFAVGGLVWAFFMRKKPRVVAATGGVWIALGSVWTVMEEQPVGLGLLLVGIVCLVWGGINLLKARQAALEPES